MSDNKNDTNKKPVKPIMEMANEINEALMNEWMGKSEQKTPTSLEELAKVSSQKTKKTIIPRMSFTDDPMARDNYMGLFKSKRKLLPDSVIKRIKTENHLVSSILRARGNTMSMFGRIRRDRFDIGMECNIKQEFDNLIGNDERIKIEERIARAMNIIVNCGRVDGLAQKDRMLLSEFFNVQTQNGLAHGRFATEIIRDEDGNFHRFRPADSGTIFKSVRRGDGAESVRQSSLRLLESESGVKIDLKKAKDDVYSWIQVVENIPRQAFTDDEMLVTNLYPSTDIEYNGYPVTPLDTCIQSVTTHASIDVYNRLYFSNGRAAKGMLVIQSDEVDLATIEGIKQQFNASINSVGNAFRTPVFGVGKDDSIQWLPMNGQKKDGEFQFLYDAVARNILSAFNISPDELPGYGHLSKGTNQQSLSESNNEYKLVAARDTGIRPLIAAFQDFVNQHLFPIVDPELAQLCIIEISGLDADTRETEALRIQQDAPLHMTMDELMEKVDKNPVGSHLAGEINFNERHQVIVDKYLDTSHFMGHMIDPSHIVDPMLKYKRDGFWFQQLQMMMQINPESVKAMFAYRPDAIDVLKMLSKDMLDSDMD
jgi:hypothetical protein